MRTLPLWLAATALLTSGCVAEPVAPAAPDNADVTVQVDDLSYEPERIQVVAGEPTVLHLTNDGGLVHDLVLDSGWTSGDVRPGQAVTITIDPLTASTTAWCSVPGHRSAGMELDVVVNDADT